MACIQALKCMNYPQRNVVEMYWILSPSVLSNGIVPISDDIVPFQQTWPCLGTPLLQAWETGSGELPNPTGASELLLELPSLLNGWDINIRAVEFAYFPLFGTGSQKGLSVKIRTDQGK